MAQFYADENFPYPVVEQLRILGHDVLTISESGKAEKKTPEGEVLKFASDNNRILLTLNRKHFIRLHTENSNHAGIIVCTFDPDFLGQAQRIHAVTIERSEIAKNLIRVNRPLN